jgi:hypothetical protein
VKIAKHYSKSDFSNFSIKKIITLAPAPQNWNSRPNDISKANWNKLRSVYASVKDIDLFTGLLAERYVRH